MKCSQCDNDLKGDVHFCPRCGARVAKEQSKDSPGEIKLPSAAKLTEKRGMSVKAKSVYLAIAAFLLASMAIVFVKSLPGGEHPVIQAQPSLSPGEQYDGVKLTATAVEAKVENGYIVISLPKILEKKMVSFTYDGKSKKVEMIAYVNPQGKLVTSIAMCEPCNSKSFHTESQDLVCDNCGTRWNFTTLEGISGACQKYPPDPIPSQIVGSEVRISERLVSGWKMRI